MSAVDVDGGSDAGLGLDGSGGGAAAAPSLVDWSSLPAGLITLSVAEVWMEEEHMEQLAGSCPDIQ